MLPFVSVIIPLRNEAKRLPQLLDAMASQDYPVDRFEIVFGDNGSTDATNEIVLARNCKNIRIFREEKPGSYAARNKALAHAKGEIIAFTDGDCTPLPNWISAGVNRISTGADLVAGAVLFKETRNGMAHFFDKKFFLQQQRSVAEASTAATANLFVRKQVVDQIGGFSDRIQSGGDFAFCRSATKAGFQIVFDADAAIIHPTRGLIPLLKKAHRIGKGKSQRLRYTSESAKSVLPRPRQLPQLMSGESLPTKFVFSLLYVLVCTAGLVGVFQELMQGRKGLGNNQIKLLCRK